MAVSLETRQMNQYVWSSGLVEKKEKYHNLKDTFLPALKQATP